MSRIVTTTVLLAQLANAYATPGSAHECQPQSGPHFYQPQFHIIGGMEPGANGTMWPGGVNDANAVFGREGEYHVMHQCDGGPGGAPCGGGWQGRGGGGRAMSSWFHSWGHVVSKDLVHWRRIADALTPNSTTPGYEYGEDCDGSLSFLDGEPIITFGPGCDPPRRSKGVGGGLGDAPVVAIARAKQPLSADANLTQWVRDAENPIAFDSKSPPCSFPGSIWRSSAGGTAHWNMLCAPGGHGPWARYSTTDPSLHGPWTLRDTKFATDASGKGVGGSSGPSFLPLPRPKAGEPTHVISNGAGHPVTYSFGTYDEEKEHMHIAGATAVDAGAMGWPAAGVANASAADEGRLLVVGWVSPSSPHPQDPRCPKIAGISICGVQTISCVRTLEWSASAKQLLTAPVHEYETLRNASLLSWSAAKQLPPNAVLPLPLPKDAGNALDIDITVRVPDNAGAFVLALRVFAKQQSTFETRALTRAWHESEGGTTFSMSTSAAAADGSRTVTVGSSKYTLMKSEGLQLRTLLDRSIAEFFGNSRAAQTVRAYPARGYGGLELSSTAGVALQVVSAGVWSMGCGWAQ